MSGGFDWVALRRLAWRELGLKPAEFWALTPAEFWALIGVELGPAPMGRARLDELIRAFPDKGAEQ